MTETEKKRVEELVARYNQLRTQRLPWEAQWKEIARLVNPRRNNFEQEQATVPSGVYTAVPIAALTSMVQGLVGNLVSRSVPWLRIRAEEDSLNSESAVRAWLQDVESRLYAELNRSNFYDVLPEIFADAGSIGTACVHVEEDLGRGRLHFTARHPKELYIAADRYGVVDTVFRKYQMTTKQILEEFDDLPLNWAEENKERQYKLHDVLHCVLPQERDIDSDKADGKAYASVYILMQETHLLRESGIDELADIVWRWECNSDEVYGRSPAWTVLPDIKRLNRIAKDLAQLGEYTANPAVQYPGRIEYRLSLLPGGRNPYRSPDEVIMPIKLGDYPVEREREVLLEQSVREAFFVDFFLGLQNLTKTMTIPEVMERQAEKATVLSVAVGRIDSELLDPIIERVFSLSLQAGRMPMPPEELLGERIAFDYIGPLAQILRRSFSTQGIKRGLEAALPFAQFNGEILDLVNWDATAKELMIESGMPEKLFADEKTLKRVRQARAEQAKALQKQQALEAMGKAAGNLNKPAEENSLLNQIGGAVG